MNTENNFSDAPSGRFAITAVEFLHAALILDSARMQEGKILFRPTLALAGHGLELILKACLKLNGGSSDFKGRSGHDLWPMWEDNRCVILRQIFLVHAKEVLFRAQQNDSYYDVPKPDDYELIMPMVKELCDLHSKYELRYRMQDSSAPPTPWLVKTLYETSNEFFRQPNLFKLPNS